MHNTPRTTPHRIPHKMATYRTPQPLPPSQFELRGWKLWASLLLGMALYVTACILTGGEGL